MRGHLLVLEGEASGDLIKYQNSRGNILGLLTYLISISELIKLVKKSESSSSYGSNSELEDQEEVEQQKEEDKREDQTPRKEQI